MESIYFVEIENIKGVLFNLKQVESRKFLDSLNQEQKENYKDMQLLKKMNDVKNKVFKEKKNSFFCGLTAEQIENHTTLERAKQSYKSLLKIEMTLAINNLLKNEIQQ